MREDLLLARSPNHEKVFLNLCFSSELVQTTSSYSHVKLKLRYYLTIYFHHTSKHDFFLSDKARLRFCENQAKKPSVLFACAAPRS